MNLNKLPQNLQYEIIQLTEDQVFQQRFAKDQQLDYLESLKHDKQIEFHELQLILNRKLKIFGLELNPLSLALYSYLYSIKSNIVFDLQKVTIIDLDLFFYLLQTKDFSYDLKSVLLKSANYCQRVLKIKPENISNVFAKIYKICFRCLNLFPRTGEQKDALFNVDWITSIVSKVKPLTSYSTEELYKDVSMSQIYYYFANYCRMQGDQRIFIRTEDEILYEEDLRMCELVVDRLIEKDVIAQGQRDNIIKLIVQEKE